MPAPVVTAVVTAPWGPVRIAATRDGVVAAEQRATEDEFEDLLARRLRTSPVPAGHPAADPAASTQLERAVAAYRQFLDGELDALDGIPLDLGDRAPFDREVYAAVRSIPPGSTASYGEVARMVGRPGAARAVGGAVGRNPIGLAIPCHRVIAGDGTLGGYGAGGWGGRVAGLELKRTLLAREGVTTRPARSA